MNFPTFNSRGMTAGCAMFLLGLSGCMASESQKGDAFVYKKTILYALMLLVVALVLMVIGGGVVWENLKALKKGKRGSRGRGSRKRAKAPASPGKNITGVVLGSAAVIGGFLVLVLGVPSGFTQHITVSKDKVTMRLSTLWFTGSQKEIPYSSISGIEKKEEEVMSRRGRRVEQTMIIHHSGGTERIKMGPLEKAAYPKLEEMYNAYKANPGKQPPAGDQPANNAGGSQVAKRETAGGTSRTSPPDTPHTGGLPSAGGRPGVKLPTRGTTPASPAGKSVDTSGLTPTDFAGRYFSGVQVMVRLPSGPYVRAQVVEVYTNGKLKVRPRVTGLNEDVLVDLSAVKPSAQEMAAPKNFGPGTPIDPTNPPAPGTTVLAFYGGRWFAVKVISSAGSRTRIRWPDDRTVHNTLTRWLRYPPAEGVDAANGKRYEPGTVSGLTPTERFRLSSIGSRMNFRDGIGSREVVIVQPYREGVIKVRDVKTKRIIHAFPFELERIR